MKRNLNIGMGWQAAIVAGALLILLIALSAAAGAQTFSVVYKFQGLNNPSQPDAANPGAGVTTDGTYVYGTSVYGGASGYGSVWEVDPTVAQPDDKALYSFSGGNDGASPASEIIFGPSASLYGTTSAGEANDCNGIGGCGTIFSLVPLYQPCFPKPFCYWTYTLIWTFGGAGSGDGSDPYGAVAFDNSGNMYGTTRYGGTGGAQGICADNVSNPQKYGCGTVFEVAPNGKGGWGTPTIRWNFHSTLSPSCPSGADDGMEPASGVVFDGPNGTGNLHGTTLIRDNSDGSGAYGMTFHLTPGSPWSEQIISPFDGGSLGAYSFGEMSLHSSTLYGISADAGGSGYGEGRLFELTSNGSVCGGWQYQEPPMQGYSGIALNVQGARSALVMDASGNLWGTQATGGNYNYGRVFELTNSGGTWIYAYDRDFMGGTDGAYPQGGLAFDSSGNIYGATYSGGQSCTIDNNTPPEVNSLGCGVVFKIVP